MNQEIKNGEGYPVEEKDEYTKNQDAKKELQTHLNKRNTETVIEQIARFEKMLGEGMCIIANQQGTLQMLNQKVAMLENALNIHKMGLVGTGPTAKP